MFPDQSEGLLRAEFVFEVGEVDRGDQLFWCEIEEELPERDAPVLGPQIPARIGNRSEREVGDALVGAEPAKLLFV